MSTRIFIIIFIILLLLSGAGIYGTISYYGKYSNTKASLQCYIDEYGRILSGFIDAKQFIRQLGERNKAIAEATRKGLSIIEGKYNP